MFTPPPSKKDIANMEFLGLQPEDFAGEDIEVWPDNQRAYLLFVEIRTQWRVGAMGPTGLDYGVLFRKMDRMNLQPDEYDELEDDIRTMECAAMGAMNSAT
jgi:hypothetical protein